MNKDVKNKDNPSLSEEEIAKLSDEDIVVSGSEISGTVPKKRLNKVIGERNVLREEKTVWTEREKELLQEIKDLDDYKALKDLANSDPRIGQGIMKGLNEVMGEEGVKGVKKRVPQKVVEAGKSNEDRDLEDIKQDLADIKIEKHFDAIGVKEEEIKKLTEFCKKRGYDMKDRTLLGMAYKEIFPKKEEPVDDKKTEPDSSSIRSGIDYGDEEVKTIDDAIAFARKRLSKKKK